MNNNKSRVRPPYKLIYLNIFIFCIIFLSGCGDYYTHQKPNNKDGIGPETGGTLFVSLESNTDVLDPHLSKGWVSFRVLYQIYEGLVSENLGEHATGDSIVPALATSWDISSDGRAFTFHLRVGVFFHDGTPFDAEAVKYNVERMYKKDAVQYDPIAANTTRYLWKYLESVEVLDPLTVTLKFSTPFYEFPKVLTQLGMGSGGIISPTALRKWGDKIGEHPVGTGPFKFAESSGGKILLERNDQYWGAKAHLDRIVFLQIPDPVARVNALQTGEVDLIFAPPPESIQDLGKAGYVINQGTTTNVWFLSLNTKDPVLKDIRVRRAIAMAINKEKMVRELLKDTAKPAQGLQAPGNSSYDADYKGLPFNIDRARGLLAEAGYPKGFDTILQTSVSGSGQILPVQIARWIQSDLSRVGINVRIETFEWIKYINIWASGIKPGVGITQLSWGMTANYWLDLIVHSGSVPPKGYNSNYYNNKEVDTLLERALTEPNDNRRAVLYRKANEVVMEDAWHIPIVNDLAPIIMNSKVKGFIHNPPEWYDFKLVWISETKGTEEMN